MANFSKRVAPQRSLEKEETISSFEAWRGNLMYILNTDENFSPFLDSNKSWDKKVKGGRQHRGLSSAQELNYLELMLGQIANFCPVISRNTIIRNSTSIDSVWQLIKSHYNIQTSGSNFLNLHDMKLESGERHEDLYQRIQTFFENNLLTVGCGIAHHGVEVTDDEELSPTLENVIVYTWLQLIHKDLPALVKLRYGTTLRHRTLASIKPEISSALDSLLEELGNASSTILRASGSSGGSHQRGFTPRQYQGQSSNTNYRSFSRGGFSAGGFRTNTNNRGSLMPQPSQGRPPVCSICKNAGRQSNHRLSSCSLLTPEDKRWISRARVVSALDELQLTEEDVDHPFVDYEDNSYTMNPMNQYYDDSRQQQVSFQEPPALVSNPGPPPSTKRVTTCPSPYINVFYFHTPIKFTVDTGATVNMIHESVANQLGLTISPSTQIATQADGKSEIDIIGEVRFQVTRDNQLLHFEGLVGRKMDTEVLAGIPFIVQNNISIHPARNVVMINDTQYPYGNSSAKACVARVKSFVARCTSKSQTVWPGEFFEASCKVNPGEDADVAVEPHWMATEKAPPIMTKCLKGTIRLVNDSDHPIQLNKDQHVAHVVQSVYPEDIPDTASLSLPTSHQSIKSHSPPNIDLVSINPDEDAEFSSWTGRYRSLHRDFEHVFSDSFPGYNGHAGNVKAAVNVTNCLPPQRKGRIPFYNRDKLVELQHQFDEFERMGVFGKPEDHGINVEYVNPSFLVKKPDGGHRLVTSFGEVAKHCKPAPSLMADVDSTLRQIGQWRYIIKADLAKAYFQIPLQKSSQKYCGVVTPFRGMRVYLRSAMGMPGSESVLEELMSRILGDLILKGKVVKLADDLYCGSNTLDDLFSTWSQVLQLLSDCDLRLSATKTVILPRSTTILGWVWKQGTLSASSHQISPLLRAEVPKTIKGLRSFIGTFKALSKVIKGSSRIIGPLETLTVSCPSSEKITLSESAIGHFNAAKNSLKSTKTIHIPRRSDHLWIVTDGAVKSSGIGATLYITRQDANRPLLAGFFSAKLKQHQPRWLPCEVEALAISSACNHFRPFIIQSLHQTQVLTDSTPCVQAHGKLIRGEFSTSARCQTFLTIVTNLNVTLQHVSGASNIVADYASRNRPQCCPMHGAELPNLQIRQRHGYSGCLLR